MYLKKTAHQEIADTLRKSLPLGIKEAFLGANVVAELAPILMRIISPDLKPVNQQLIKGEDRSVLKNLVRVMLDLGLSFVQDKNEDGQIIFKLDPPLDVFVHYDGKKATDIPAARYNLRLLISQAMEAESVRRAGSGGDFVSSSKSAGDIINAYKVRAKEEQPKTSKDGVCRSHIVQSQGEYWLKCVDRDKPATDFFGRAIIAKDVSADDTDGRHKSKAWDPANVDIIVVMVQAVPKKRAKTMYKYHEGKSMRATADRMLKSANPQVSRMPFVRT